MENGHEKHTQLKVFCLFTCDLLHNTVLEEVYPTTWGFYEEKSSSLFSVMKPYYNKHQSIMGNGI